MEQEKLSNTLTDIMVAVIILLVALGALGSYLDEILRLYREFLSWFYSLPWEQWRKTLFVIFAFLDVILLGFIIFVFSRYAGLGKLATQKKVLEEFSPDINQFKSEFRESWERILKLANSSNPSDWKVAIIRADAILDDVLLHMGYQGENLAERLKIVDPTKLKSLERLWAAHRLRNQIVHDPLVEHTKENIMYALQSYHQALKELGVI